MKVNVPVQICREADTKTNFQSENILLIINSVKFHGKKDKA